MIAVHDRTLILGIESSCDETAAAVVRGGREVLSNIVASQHDLHQEYRGVVPEIASRAHAERILPIVDAALRDAGVELHELGAIAVGHRPGLIGSLVVGVAAAKALAWSLGVPVVGVDHIQAHLYAGLLEDGPPVEFPAIGLVVSGGHTALYRCGSPRDIRRLGATVDDAVGEAYDKAASVLGLPYPGGPGLDRLASTWSGEPGIELPVSRLDRTSLDFSFSGLKTSLLYAARGIPADPRRAHKPPPPAAPPLDDRRRAQLAAAFQRAAMDALLLKLERALDGSPDCRAVLVGGGVAANSLLRTRMEELRARRALDVRVPRLPFCIDNAAMIAGLGFHRLAANPAGDGLGLVANPRASV